MTKQDEAEVKDIQELDPLNGFADQLHALNGTDLYENFLKED